MRPLSLLLLLCLSARAESQSEEFTLRNSRLTCTIGLSAGRLAYDRVWLSSPRAGSPSAAVETDAEFTLDVMWSDWRPPGKKNNAENPTLLTAADFTFLRADSAPGEGGGRRWNFYFAGPDRALFLRVTYLLGANDFYIRRSLAVMDSAGAGHLLREMRSRDCLLRGNPRVIKRGGFGQPAALAWGNSRGAFFGLEYPASQNTLDPEGTLLRLRCGQEMGELIRGAWLAGEPVVEGVVPDTAVRLWFLRYVDDIRVAPLRPYTLYNSWYDLRSRDFKGIPPENVMNEENVLRIIGLIDRNMISRHGIHLDAFVLDDGWDVYESDWVLRPVQFPRGLRPIADELGKSGTVLGMWLGPTGGYSFHDRRMAWMKAHGYELVDNQLCLAGARYSALFRMRVEDFVRNDGVGYFKWDGIQFACNDPGHGHPVDIYSRRAVMESVIDKCRAVRAINPATFLNITSGTWLSPWWLKYANQIWMDGQDYGYADVPSISPRDAAITYKDFVLYEDFRTKDLWFPLANMMTHGIIKGTLEKLGGEQETIDKFTNETLLYLARGVSMWEMYISPDILTDREWDAIARSMAWAKDRFPILSTTTMIGGDPKARQTYGYVHFSGDRGVIAARNPSIEPATLEVPLSASLGLGARADSLVLERVYPSHWISPRLTRAGRTVVLPLDGYETAVYEVYPLRSAEGPLVAGVRFAVQATEGAASRISLYPLRGESAELLNPAVVRSVRRGTVPETSTRWSFRGPANPPPVHSVRTDQKKAGQAWEMSLRVDSSAHNAMVALLLRPAAGERSARPPGVEAVLDGQKAQLQVESQKGMWAWFTLSVLPGEHTLAWKIVPEGNVTSWKGHGVSYLICDQALRAQELTIELNSPYVGRPMPPSPTPPGTFRVNTRLGEMEVAMP